MLTILLVFTAHVYFINVFILLIFNKITSGTHTNAYNVNKKDKREIKGRKELEGDRKKEITNKEN